MNDPSRFNPVSLHSILSVDRSLVLTPTKAANALSLNELSEEIGVLKFSSGRKGSYRQGTMFDQPVRLKDTDRSLSAILGSKENYPKFKNFLQYSFAEENIQYLEVVAEYEKLVQSSQPKAALLTKLQSIVETFIEEGSALQVNIASDTRRSIVATLGAAEADEELVQMQELSNVLHPSRLEIFELVSRNFVHRFWRKIDKEKTSEALLINLSGSYGKIWRLAGINGYQRAFKHLSVDTLDQVKNLRSYIVQIVSIAENQLPQLDAAERNHIFTSSSKVEENTVSYAINSLKTGFDLRRIMINSYLNNVRTQVLPVLDSLISTMTSSLEEIKLQYTPAIQEMLEAKHRLNNVKTDTTKELLALQQREPQKKKSKKNGAKHAEQVQKIKEQLASKVNQAEFDLGMIESKHSEFMLQAMESLESLELHRLDKTRDILIRQASAEQGNLFMRIHHSSFFLT